jgi:hypothetical protein
MSSLQTSYHEQYSDITVKSNLQWQLWFRSWVSCLVSYLCVVVVGRFQHQWRLSQCSLSEIVTIERKACLLRDDDKLLVDNWHVSISFYLCDQTFFWLYLRCCCQWMILKKRLTPLELWPELENLGCQIGTVDSIKFEVWGPGLDSW